MSIAFDFERNNNSKENANSNTGNNNNYNHDLNHNRRSGFDVHDRMTYFPIYSLDNNEDDAEFGGGDVVGDRPSLKVAVENPVDDSSSSSSSSSIGKNSSDGKSSAEKSLLEGGGEAEEVQSKFKDGGALNNLQELEEVLPIKRSISNFYSGKSKSFTSLSEAVTCSSIKEIVKPENAYTRKRKNLLAYSNFWDKNHSNSIRRSSSGGGMSKRPLNSRSTMRLAATMGCAESHNNNVSPISNSSSPGIRLPPLPPQVRRSSPNEESSSSSSDQMFSPWRSLSLSDLQGASVATKSKYLKHSCES